MAVDVQVDDDQVAVGFSGLERLLTLKGGVELPIRSVASARVAPTAEVAAERAWRLFGSHLPGAVTAGEFSSKGEAEGRQLWCVERDDEVLVIDLHEDAEIAYRRVVLQHPDRHDLAWWIGERVQGEA